MDVSRGTTKVSSAVRTISVDVFRYTPSTGKKGYFQRVEIESPEAVSVKNLLDRVHSLDPTFACRTFNCFKGMCGACMVRVNGKNVFGCITLVQPGEYVKIEPHSKYKVIRDVVVDFSRPLSLGRQESGSNECC